MKWMGTMRLDFGTASAAALPARIYRRGLRLAIPPQGLHGPEKYRTLDVRRRRAQIRARREFGLV
jgi:hypothetical protein